MATNGKGTGMVGYNVQAVVDAKHHLIIAHEVTNVGHDRFQLANMARQAKEVTGSDDLTVLADRGYFSGPEVKACEEARVTPIDGVGGPDFLAFGVGFVAPAEPAPAQAGVNSSSRSSRRQATALG